MNNELLLKPFSLVFCTVEALLLAGKIIQGQKCARETVHFPFFLFLLVQEFLLHFSINEQLKMKNTTQYSGVALNPKLKDPELDSHQ